MITALFDGRLAPLTYSIGFLNAPSGKVADALTGFFTRVHHGGRATILNGALEDNLLRLQPLVIGARPRILLAPTALDGWTALFDGDAYGQGVGEIASYMAETMGVRGYFVSSVPPATRTGHWLGSRQFYMLGPERKLGTIRAVELIENSPGRWNFETGGQVQPYEDFAAYRKRRRADRFTEQMLIDYAAAVGLHPWDETFYHNPSHLITNGAKAISAFTLPEARAKLGLDD